MRLERQGLSFPEGPRPWLGLGGQEDVVRIREENGIFFFSLRQIL